MKSAKPPRLIAICAALGGAASVALLALAAHKAAPELARYAQSGGIVLGLHASAALIALSRSANGPAFLLVLGSWVFASAMSLLAFAPALHIPGLAPMGGLTLIAGWLWLAVSELRRAG
jgi:uncharacterized membrane protein YgdD (TMEM256/DUF423 family)